MNSWNSMIAAALIVASILVVIAALFLSGIVIVAVQARGRGYSLWLWMAAGLLTINPVIFLVMLALMPNRSRLRLREKFRAELDAKLAGRKNLPPAPAVGPVPTGTTLTANRSLGDLPTFVPRDRSLGDEETRGTRPWFHSISSASNSDYCVIAPGPVSWPLPAEFWPAVCIGNV